MVKKVRRMPGTACRYFEQGRCLYEERLNPGYNRAWRCRVLLRWEEAYDTFLAQADNFVIDPETAAGIWQQRLGELMRQGHGCPDHEPGGRDMTGCGRNLGGLCLTALPPCPGQCRRFEARDPGHDQDPEPENS